MYTIPDQAPFAGNLREHEVVFKLDTGEYIGVVALCSVEPNSGNPVARAEARVLDGTGLDVLDGTGQPIRSEFSHTSNPTEQAALGGPNGLKREVVLAVLGEAAQLWSFENWHDTMRENASIRTNLASAAHAGPVTNLAAIMGGGR